LESGERGEVAVGVAPEHDGVVDPTLALCPGGQLFQRPAGDDPGQMAAVGGGGAQVIDGRDRLLDQMGGGGDAGSQGRSGQAIVRVEDEGAVEGAGER